ncbi:nuclear transport factor 2 family protein [Candidatus Marinimicrobia bacterium]|nr:nuclear transport factor 2 family protein [Candidatus Neomarinimicrobiota bacterium]
MSILEKWAKAVDDRDISTMSELMHDDYEFTLHSAGKILYKQDVLDWVAMDDIVATNNRILYENDEIGVNHAVVTFKSDGNVQGVLAFFRFKNGKIFRQETGASNLPKS